MLLPMLNILYLYVNAFRRYVCAMRNMAVFCSLFLLCFLIMLLSYFLNDYVLVPVAPFITGITFAFTYHIPCIYTVNSLILELISLSVSRNCKIYEHKRSFFTTQILMSGLLLGIIIIIIIIIIIVVVVGALLNET
jgi:hypothetical protein